MGSLQLDFTKPTPDKSILYQRTPLITETQALYQQSGIFSDNANVFINKFNSTLEITLTICIFVSSFLVLSIEKYWWGGYLSNPQIQTHYSGIKASLSNSFIYENYKMEIYTINNLIRLVVVASSITFFMMITCLEITQMIVTYVYS